MEHRSWRGWWCAASDLWVKRCMSPWEDEFGHSPLVVWPQVYERLRLVLRESLLLVGGVVSRQEGTMNVVVHRARSIKGVQKCSKAKNWG